jgi:hypothetical protein
MRPVIRAASLAVALGLRAALFRQRQVDQSAASALIKSRGGSIEIKN